MLREYEEPVEMMIELVKQDRSDRRRSDEWLSELASVCGVRGNEEEKRKGVLQRCREWVKVEEETKKEVLTVLTRRMTGEAKLSLKRGLSGRGGWE